MREHFYHTKLPHFQPAGAGYFITYRLEGSLPVHVIQQMRWELEMEKAKLSNDKGLSRNELKKLLYDTQKFHFGKVDDFLDKNPNEPHWLKLPEVASIVSESLHLCAERYFKLWCFCIMSNHVHVLLTLKPRSPVLFKVMQSHKSFTAKKCNVALGREGMFWERESYDHIVRKDGEFWRILFYILNNPVKAKLVKEWQDWPWTFVHPDVHSNSSLSALLQAGA